MIFNEYSTYFPGKCNQYTPDDDLVYCANYNSQSPLWLAQFPPFDEIHISCIFTWDMQFCEELKYQIESSANKLVRLGGAAYRSNADDFTQGLYLKRNVIFTSRGCNNQCPRCIVPKIEVGLKELAVHSGNIIQDNNFLQTSKSRKDKVFEMLKTQKQICFKGGLEPESLDNNFVKSIASLRIKELWLACDTDGALSAFRTACEKLSRAGFSREKVKCYTLIGDDMDKNEGRLCEIYNAGAMPFAQLYRDFSQTKTECNKDWNAFARM